MAQELVVRVVGDASSLERTFKKSTASANNFGRSMGRLGRGGFAATGAFSSLGRSVAFASGAFLGGAGLVATVKTSVEAASNLNEQISKSNVIFGSSAASVIAWSKTSVNSMALAQDQALETASSFGGLLTTVGLTGQAAAKQSEGLTKLGVDLASLFNTDVPQALDALRSGLVGESEPLRKYNILLSESRVQTKALEQTGKTNVKNLTNQEKVLARLAIIYEDSGAAQGDFARTSGGLANQQRILAAQVRQVEIGLGQALLPTINGVVTSLNEWLSQSKNQKRIMVDIREATGFLTAVIGGLKDSFHALNEITGSTKSSLELLLTVFLGFKALKLASSLAGFATNLGLVGTNAARAAPAVAAAEGEVAAIGASAATATPKVAGLRGLLAGLAAIGVITVAVEVVLHKKQIEDFLGSHGVPAAHSSGLELIRRAFPDAVGPRWLSEKLGLERKARGIGKDASDAVAKARDTVTKAIDKTVARFRSHPVLFAGTDGTAATAETKAQRTARLARIRQARQAARDAVVERAQFAVERAETTKTFEDDLAALNKLQALLKRRIAGGHGTLALERELLSVQQQIVGVHEKQAEAAKAQAEAAKKARAARQFRVLGFGPTGEDLVPGVKNLKKQLGSVSDAVSGSFLDTRKTRGLLGHIRQVLSGGLGSVSSEVRSKIQQILADLKDQLKKSSVDVTRFQKTASGQFALAGATPGARGITIQGGIHLHGVQNVKEMEEALAKRRKRRAHARRGTR